MGACVAGLQSRDCKQNYFCKLAITLPVLPSFGSASSRILPLYHKRMGRHVVTRALHRSRPSNRYRSVAQFSQISQLRQNSKVDRLRTVDSLVEVSCIFFLWPKQVYRVNNGSYHSNSYPIVYYYLLFYQLLMWVTFELYLRLYMRINWFDFFFKCASIYIEWEIKFVHLMCRKRTEIKFLSN